jgi:acyl-coenzyme A synthetase/AMP-(fatty) acid ligase
VCYVVPKDQALTEQSVLQHARQFLPAAKAPKQVVIVPDLPKNDRGKVLREKLKEDWLRRMGVSA